MYPFGDVNRVQYRQLADKILSIELSKADASNTKAVDDKVVLDDRTITEEAIFVSIGYLVENFSIDCSLVDFADVFAQGGIGILSASSFRFASYISIELSEYGRDRAVKYAQAVATLRGRTSIVIGSMQDYFPMSCSVAFADLTSLRDSVCDEGVLIKLLFKVSAGMLPGSFLILVTSLQDFNAQDFGFLHRSVGSLTLRLHTLDTCYINVFQCAAAPRRICEGHKSKPVRRCTSLDHDEISSMITFGSDEDLEVSY